MYTIVGKCTSVYACVCACLCVSVCVCAHMCRGVYANVTMRILVDVVSVKSCGYHTACCCRYMQHFCLTTKDSW